MVHIYIYIYRLYIYIYNYIYIYHITYITRKMDWSKPGLVATCSLCLDWFQEQNPWVFAFSSCMFFPSSNSGKPSKSGWWFEPLRKIMSQLGTILPNIWKNKKMLQTTNQKLVNHQLTVSRMSFDLGFFNVFHDCSWNSPHFFPEPLSTSPHRLMLRYVEYGFDQLKIPSSLR